VGIASLMVVPPAAKLPTLEATIVYATVPPGVADVALVLFCNCTTGTPGTAALLVQGGGVLPGAHSPSDGGCALAVLITDGGADAGSEAVMVYVTTPPTGNVAMV
jgi:hypothetical protein